MNGKVPRKPMHPGEVLRTEFLEKLQISQYRVAKEIAVPPRRINEIVMGKRSISPDTALRLGRYFGNEEAYWLGLQSRYDLESTKARLGDALMKGIKPYQPSKSVMKD